MLCVIGWDRLECYDSNYYLLISYMPFAFLKYLLRFNFHSLSEKIAFLDYNPSFFYRFNYAIKNIYKNVYIFINV